MARRRIEQVTVLGPLLDQLTLDQENARRRPSNSFHASSIETCGRQQWYAIKGYQQDPSMDHADWKRTAEAGNLLHEAYQAHMLETGLVIPTDELFAHTGWTRDQYPDWQREKLPDQAVEVPLPPNPYQIGGRIDVVIRFKGVLMIVDIKTMKQKDYDAMPSSPKMKKYTAQLQVYMNMTGIEHSVVFCANRNDSTHKEYLVPHDKVWCEEQFRRIGGLKAMLDEGILPPPEPSWGCNFCAFSSLCADNSI